MKVNQRESQMTSDKEPLTASSRIQDHRYMYTKKDKLEKVQR